MKYNEGEKTNEEKNSTKNNGGFACSIECLNRSFKIISRENTMSQVIVLGKEMLRINPKNTCHIEFSYNGGRSWLVRYLGTTAGQFKDLQVVGNEIIAVTSKGTFYSTTQGRTWLFRNK